jgi:hypothetical protein
MDEMAMDEIAENIKGPISESKCFWCHCVEDEISCYRAFNGDDYTSCMWRR